MLDVLASTLHSNQQSAGSEDSVVTAFDSSGGCNGNSELAWIWGKLKFLSYLTWFCWSLLIWNLYRNIALKIINWFETPVGILKHFSLFLTNILFSLIIWFILYKFKFSSISGISIFIPQILCLWLHFFLFLYVLRVGGNNFARSWIMKVLTWFSLD